jgi:hypothetical protein
MESSQRRIAAVLLAVCVSWLGPGAAYAQDTTQDTSVRDVLSFLMTNRAVPTGDFARDQEAANATRETIARALLVELATLPITTSSGGFSFRFNPALGTVERVTQTFGPFFVDRATTAGRRQASISMTYRHSSYVSLDDRTLNDGTLVTTANKFRDEAAPFDVDALSMTIRSNTVTLFANYGLTDRIDIGVAVPIVQLSLSGERINTYRGASFVEARGSGQSSGLADTAVRGKVQLLRWSSGQVATDLELRLPTGSVEELRGGGRAAYKGSVVASAGNGAVEAHMNSSLTFGGISREAAIGAAVTAAPTNRVTFSGEALMRRIDALNGIEAVAQPNPQIAGMDTIRLLPTAGATTTVTAIGGFRLNLTSTWLLNGYIAVPMTNGGLKARPIPALALDYSFVH